MKMTEHKTCPLVSVIMPVYNGELYLHVAIQSILSQTYKNLELIIVDDASIDNSNSIIASFTDKRIFYYRNLENSRTAFTLNRGIKIAKGQLIARMDQDDIALETRLEEQVSFLRDNKEIDICGTQIERFGMVSENVVSNYPLEHSDIQLMLLFRAPFAHSSVMLRHRILEESGYRYDENFLAEGLTLWRKLLLNYKSANLPKVLMQYRIHSTSITKTYYRRIGKEAHTLHKSYAISIFNKTNKLVIECLYSNVSFLRRSAIKRILKREAANFDITKLKNWLSKLDDFRFKRNIWRHRRLALSRIMKEKFVLSC